MTYRGKEWKLAVFNRQIRTKLGVAFEADEVAMAKTIVIDGMVSVVAYSHRNGIDTGVPLASVRWLTEACPIINLRDWAEAKAQLNAQEKTS